MSCQAPQRCLCGQRPQYQNRVFRLTGFNVCRCQFSRGSKMNPNELPLSNGKWADIAVILLPWSNFQTLHKTFDSLIGPSVRLIFYLWLLILRFLASVFLTADSSVFLTADYRQTYLLESSQAVRLPKNPTQSLNSPFWGRKR